MTQENAKNQVEDETQVRIEKSRALALLAAQAGLAKKAIGVEIIDVSGKVDYADFLVLMTGTSQRHCQAIARAVDEDLSAHGDAPLSMEGQGSSEWVLIDFFDVVVHVFAEDSRELYDLSGLWMDAERVGVPEPVRDNS
ncbi:MAG: ribosome silencing factor [Polyangiaceae bacterium]|nr:ribosome silencing factor [Polyangiaceae bacterium]